MDFPVIGHSSENFDVYIRVMHKNIDEVVLAILDNINDAVSPLSFRFKVYVSRDLIEPDLIKLSFKLTRNVWVNDFAEQISIMDETIQKDIEGIRVVKIELIYPKKYENIMTYYELEVMNGEYIYANKVTLGSKERTPLLA